MSNMVVNGKWGWDHMHPSLVGKATNLIRKLRDEYYKALDQYDVLITPTAPMLSPKLPPADASIVELMKNSAGASMNTSAFNIVSVLKSLEVPPRGAAHSVLIHWKDT